MMFRKFLALVLSIVSVFLGIAWLLLMLIQSTFLNPSFYQDSFFDSFYAPVAQELHAGLLDRNPDFASHVDIDDVEILLRKIYPLKDLSNYFRGIVTDFNEIEFDWKDGYSGLELDVAFFKEPIPDFVAGLSDKIYDGLPECRVGLPSSRFCRQAGLVSSEFQKRLKQEVEMTLEKDFPREVEVFHVAPNDLVPGVVEYFSVSKYLQVMTYIMLSLLVLIALLLMADKIVLFRSFAVLFGVYATEAFWLSNVLRSALESSLESLKSEAGFIVSLITSMFDSALFVLISYAVYFVIIALAFLTGMFILRRNQKDIVV